MLNNRTCENSTNQNQSQEKEETGPERLNRLRSEMAGKVWIPEIWGQERLLKEWSDCSAFDRSMVPEGLMSARRALMDEYRKTESAGLGIENRCS